MTNAFAFDSKQFESFVAPARAFASLYVDMTEKLLNAQLDATKAYSDASLAQLRRLVEVKDAKGFNDYLAGQQDVAKELTERLKGDADKVVALQQDFVEQSQKLTEESVKQAQESAKEATESASKAVKEVAPKAATK
ncbi:MULTISPECIES: phasin family protein [Halomonas]|uniref:Phasin family protein n=1 Tax=Halomonas ventosae TaxID=229007 RepID=A0A4R6I6Q6_9GAMM|nr:phasin family protein [Halomonas ventosae]TDO16828.1 phasin family protein [Halomonas ventosae]